jgi:hypothetical protein
MPKTKVPALFVFLLLLVLLSFTACNGSASAPSQSITAPTATFFIEPEAASEEDALDTEAAQVGNEAQAAPTAELANVSNGEIQHPVLTSNRKIIKNAELELLVEDTNTTINRSLGIITEYDGYVISNRTWFKDDLKYATLAIGVPVDNFEEMLRRLKDLAISVVNETASGQDVTDQFVDLESRLRNLEATSARIREFLEQAKDVQQSLEVNAQLTQIEGEIEQVKGQMAYLRDRAAFSTITLQISPQLPTPTPTPEPTPTPTPEPWSPGQTFNKASGVTSQAAQNLFQFSVDLVIWAVVVILPFALPLVGLVWLGTRLARRAGVSAGRQ